MKAFHCDSCGNLLFFENFSCLSCSHVLGFLPDAIDLCALEPAEAPFYWPLAPAARSKRYRPCQNGTDHQACNWWIAEDDDNPLCRSCRLNLVIPDLSAPGSIDRWRKLESAKRRVIYTSLRLKLPMEGSGQNAGLRFKFLADPPGGPPVLTGHAEGVITINIAEADDAERERRRLDLHEPFRTLMGHIRHEVAHFCWDRLIANGPHIEKFRELFGDEGEDYAAALQRHYQNGPPANWPEKYVSAYASVHPWEDWAETAAHYFHITDTLETAAAFGVSLRPRHPQASTMRAEPKKLDIEKTDFQEVMQHWMPLTHALNELNRGMGLHDLYPFVLSDPSVEKLRFVHSVFTN